MSSQPQEFVAVIVAVLEILLLIVAVSVTITSSVRTVIRGYQVQSILLALITGITALDRFFDPSLSPSERALTAFLIILVLALPLFLYQTIEFWLGRATLGGASIWPFRLTPDQRGAAEQIWLKQRYSSPSLSGFFIVGGLIAFAFGIAFWAIPSAQSSFSSYERIGLTVSLSLHLIGLYDMVAKRDIISQVVGLLTMDQGLYLAVVKIVAIPIPAMIFVISLYFYTAITIFILVILLPKVRNLTQGIDLDEIAERSELGG